jgi:outer membrane receptor protein involved in Fe transport
MPSARHEIARASEALQAQLYQPLAIAPAAPGIAFTDLRIFPEPMLEAGSNEYPRLSQPPGPRFSAGGLVGTQGTWAAEAAAGVYTDRLAVALGGVASHTDGFRPTNDLSSDLYDVFGQWLIAPGMSVQAEYRHRSTEFGDVQLRFDPTAFSLDNRFEQDEGVGRIGLRFSPAPRLVVLGSFFDVRHDETQDIVIPAALTVDADATFDSQMGELLGVYAAHRYSVLVGGAYGNTRSEINETYDFSASLGLLCLPPWVPCNPTFADTTRFSEIYTYGYVTPDPTLQVTLGHSYDTVRNDMASRELWSPKFGVTWIPAPPITLRAAAFRDFRRPLVGDQTIEPTQVAGFSQLYDEAIATES